jgi:predicted nucleic acid-binding protein
MRIIVSDSSALIDLKKGGVLELFLKLPFDFVIPDVLIESELLSFSKKEITLLKKEMIVAILDGAEVEKARAIVMSVPALSLLDGFALVVAEKHPGCILLTGDKRMRKRAEETNIECHGVLWIIEELSKFQSWNGATLLVNHCFYSFYSNCWYASFGLKWPLLDV